MSNINKSNIPMLYTEEQVLRIIKYSCSYQKASSYQDIGNILIPEGEYKTTEQDILALDNLADCDNNCHKEITIEDINDYLSIRL